MLIICSFQSFSMLYRTGCIYVPFPLRQFPSIKAKSGQVCLFQFYFLKPTQKSRGTQRLGEEERTGWGKEKRESNSDQTCLWFVTEFTVYRTAFSLWSCSSFWESTLTAVGRIQLAASCQGQKTNQSFPQEESPLNWIVHLVAIWPWSDWEAFLSFSEVTLTEIDYFTEHIPPTSVWRIKKGINIQM